MHWLLHDFIVAIIAVLLTVAVTMLVGRWSKRPNLRVLAGRMGGQLAKDAASQEEIWVIIVTVEIRNNSSGSDLVDRIELELEAVNGKPPRTSHQPVVESPPGRAAVTIKNKYYPVFAWSERLPRELPILEKPGRARGKVAFAVSLREFREFEASSPSGRDFPWRVKVFGRAKRVWASAWYGNGLGDAALR